MFIVQLFALPGLPSFISNLNFPGRVGIAGNQRSSFIRHAMAARAGHSTTYQPAVRGIDSKNIKYSGAYDAAMQLDSVFILKHGTSWNILDLRLPGSYLCSHARGCE
jgi:hypothetical protein